MLRAALPRRTRCSEFWAHSGIYQSAGGRSLNWWCSPRPPQTGRALTSGSPLRTLRTNNEPGTPGHRLSGRSACWVCSCCTSSARAFRQRGYVASGSAQLASVGGTLLLIAVGVPVVRWLRRRELIDPRLVQAKLGRDACEVELRLAVFAPSFAEPSAVQARLDRIAAAYRPFTLAAGDGLISSVRCVSWISAY